MPAASPCPRYKARWLASAGLGCPNWLSWRAPEGHNRAESESKDFYKMRRPMKKVVGRFGNEISQESWGCYITFAVCDKLMRNDRSKGNCPQTAATDLPYGRPTEQDAFDLNVLAASTLVNFR